MAWESQGGGYPPARRLPARPRRRSRADQREHLIAPAFHVLSGDERLEAQAQQRLGVGGAYVEVPVLVVDRDAVEAFLARVRVGLGDLLHLRGRIGDLGVDLPGDAVPPVVGG